MLRGTNSGPQIPLLWLDTWFSGFIMNENLFASVPVFFSFLILWLNPLPRLLFFWQKNTSKELLKLKMSNICYISFSMWWQQSSCPLLFLLSTTFCVDDPYPWLFLGVAVLFQGVSIKSTPLCNQWSDCNAMSMLFLFSLYLFNHRVLW